MGGRGAHSSIASRSRTATRAIYLPFNSDDSVGRADLTSETGRQQADNMRLGYNANHGTRVDLTDAQYKEFQSELRKGGGHIRDRQEGLERTERALWTAVAPKTVDALQSQYDSLGDQMETLARDHDDSGQMKQENRSRYYQVKRHRDLTRELLTKARDKAATARPKDNSPSHTFVNGYGEATHRYITSDTYERAQRRQEREIQNRMRGRR